MEDSRSAQPCSAALQLSDVGKSFGPVEVLKGVSFTVAAGEIVAIMGENGAGKSTLMNILSGVYADHAGEIRWLGDRIAFARPADAEAAGIVMVHQELNLVDGLSLAENIFLGREPVTRLGSIDRQRMHSQARALLEQVGCAASPETPLGKLRVGEQQLVEIAKALARDAKLLILDEPTAALSRAETDTLLAVVRSLSDQGTSVIYISHRLDEVFGLADRIVILRDGRVAADAATCAITREKAIRQMVGEEVSETMARPHVVPGETVLEATELSLPAQGGGARENVFQDIDLVVRAGEVIGIAGLSGAGIPELLEALFGMHRPRLKGTLRGPDGIFALRSPRAARQLGIAHVSDDRKRDGLVLEQSVRFNLVLPQLDRLSRMGAMDSAAEQSAARKAIDNLAIRCAGDLQPVGLLSGGNQQKVVIGKWLATQPRILLLNEPTRGVDVGAKAEIYDLLHKLTEQGIGVVLASTDLPELVGLSDRIMVMRAGEAVALLERDEFSQNAILNYAAQGGPRRKIMW